MKIKTIIAAIALMAVPALTFAQANKSNEQLSEDFDKQIDVMQLEIKTLKAKQKAEPGNSTYAAEQSQKEAQLKELKAKKKTIDEAIKADKKAQKEAKQADKAQKKHEEAEREARQLKESNYQSGMSNEQLSAQYDNQIDVLQAELKTLKAKKKAEPNNTSIAGDIAKKEAEIKETKRQKKVIDTAIKAKKTSEKERNQAEKARDKNNDAAKKANEVRSNM